jgi:signal transduction histidine kinase
MIILAVILLIAALALIAWLVYSVRQAEHERVRLAVTIEHLGEGLIVTEPGSSRIASVNPRATELVPELTPGATVDGGAGPLPPLDDALGREAVVTHGDRVLAVTATRLGGPGDPVAWVVRDATVHTRLERAKSEFVATASHELRSPLTSIKGFTELLQHDPGGLSERQREFVEIIQRSTDRLVELVDDLLDVARIDVGEVDMHRRPIDISEAVRETAQLMGPRIAAKAQVLGIYVAPTLPPAMADPARVRQIVGNLLTNAHQYTPERGRIHIGVESDRAWVRLVVADSGVGMTEEETERAFDRFYRGTGGATSPGSGLGLSIVRSLVELHGGAIEVGSRPGQGTVFSVLLPAAPAAPEDSDAVLRGRRVLVVSGDPAVVSAVTTALDLLDAETTIAADVAALPAGATGDGSGTVAHDAVVLDTAVGAGAGAALHRVRTHPELGQLPVVFLDAAPHRTELDGEWVLERPPPAERLRGVLAAAIRASRSRVLVIAREALQGELEPALDELGIEYQWEPTGAAGARACGERRFAVAAVDTGIRNLEATLHALTGGGRRLRDAVILLAEDTSEVPVGTLRQGFPVISVKEAPHALLDALRGTSALREMVIDGDPDRS